MNSSTWSSLHDSSLSSPSVPTHRASADDNISPRVAQTVLFPEEESVVSRRSRGGTTRLESPPPINRYAGDWSVCGPDLLLGQEADYDEVAGSDSDGGKERAACQPACSHS